MDSDKIQILKDCCPLCAEKTELIWKEKNYTARRCISCGVIFCPASLVPSLYDEKYFNRWYIKNRIRRKRYLKKLLGRIEILSNLEPGSLLDVGCGTGFLMEVMTEKGWHCFGIDTSIFASDYCKKMGHNVICCDFKNAGFPDGFFDVVTVFDVIAHLETPQEYLKEIRRVLKDGGILIIKTPYHSPFFFRLLNMFRFAGRTRSLLHIPAQIFHFTPVSIRNLISTNGFDVLSVLRVNDMPAFLLSFSLKSTFVFIAQLMLRIIFGSDSTIIVARKKFHINQKIKV